MCLFSNQYLYKKSFSKLLPEDYLINLSYKEITSREHKKIKKKYRKILTQNFPRDVIKEIKIKNRTKNYKNIKFIIKSKKRFININNIENFYNIKKKNYKREKKYIQEISVDLDSGQEETIYFLFEKINQNFSYDFNEKYNLSIGNNSIYAGKVSYFEEQLSFPIEEHNIEIYKNYDIKITNKHL